MRNRIPQDKPARFSSIQTPLGYQESDFTDILTEIKEKFFFGVEKNSIVLRIYSKGMYFERFNKKFYAHIFSMCGQTEVSIIEVTDNTAIQGIIHSLEEAVKEVNERFMEVTADRDNWVQRWIKVKQEFKAQKRQIKTLLQKQGIEVKAGSELSKLLRLDNIPT